MRRPGPLVIAVGAVAYISAVTQRSSMGVASIEASSKYAVNAELLSTLAVAQLVVYAAMQIPVGLLLDRFGPRIMLTCGAIFMSAGQFLVATSEVLAQAVCGRMLVGFGDAFTFISLIRLINGWYSGRRASQLQQWLGNGGQIGQLVSALPFGYLLGTSGWFNGFSVLASIAGIIGFVTWIVLRDEAQFSPREPFDLSRRISQLRSDIKKPSSQLAFWTHFTTQSSSTTLVLLWGLPFLENAERLSKPVALGILSSFVLIGFVFGFVFGQLCAHKPHLRGSAITLTTGLMLCSWLLLLAWPAQAPFPLIVFWALTIAINAPASMIAMDFTRQFVPKKKLGSVNGFVNIGGFSATFTMMFLIGLVLDLHHWLSGGESALYSLAGFRLAFLSVIAVTGFGLVMFRVNLRRVSGMNVAV